MEMSGSGHKRARFLNRSATGLRRPIPGAPARSDRHTCCPCGVPSPTLTGMTRPEGVPAQFEVRTVVFLRRGTDPPQLTEDESNALQDAHLAYLADLSRRGRIAANGPLIDQSDETLRGLSVYTVPADEALRLASGDPAVRAGRLRVDVARWCVGAGRLAFPAYAGPVGDRVAFEDL